MTAEPTEPRIQERSLVSLLVHAYESRAEVLDAINAVSPWHRLYREFTFPEIERTVLRRGNLRILDAGGGTGIFAERIAQQNQRVVLVDILPAMVRLARAKSLNLTSLGKQGFDVIRGDLENLTFLDGESFDAVICTQVLNFCADIDKVLDQFHRVLRPGGVLFADIESAYRWCVIEALDGQLDNAIAIAKEGQDRARHIVGAEYFFHSPAALRTILADRVFQLEAIWGVEYVAPYFHVLARSEEFLQRDGLPENAAALLDDGVMQKLRDLERFLADELPMEAAGWLQFVCRKPGPAESETRTGLGGRK